MDKAETVQAQLEAAKAGNQEAFAGLLRTFYPALFRLVYQMVPCAQDVEDILQETFFRFHRSLGKLRAGEDPYPFLRTIAVRRTYTHLRRPRLHEVPLDLLPEDLPQLTVLDHAVGVQVLYGLVRELPAKRRMVFVLREILGIEDLEIARLLSLREGTVRRHAMLARKDLERRLSER